MDAPHYLRFARNLALATTIALPACSGADATASVEEVAKPVTSPKSVTSAVETAAAPTAPPRDALVAAPIDPIAAEILATDAPPDAGSYQGHSSGPLPPPEMPASIG